MFGDQTLLTQTRRRISPVFNADEIITVVTKKHEAFYSGELTDWPQRTVIVQPENRGTGIALATTILMLRDFAPETIVATFPCDHHYISEAAFVTVIEAGIGVARSNSDAIVLVGAEATWPETEYGWIQPRLSTTTSALRPHASVSSGRSPPLQLRRICCAAAVFGTPS
jgi:mannose-1-phosphate guanylyltransferase